MELIFIVILIAFFIGVFLILFSGVFYVKKKVKGHGLYFMTPFFVRRVGLYPADIQRTRFTIKPFDVFLTYQISDAQKYHYQGHNFKEYVMENLKNVEKDAIPEWIKQTTENYGITLLDLKIKDNFIQP